MHLLQRLFLLGVVLSIGCVGDDQIAGGDASTDSSVAKDGSVDGSVGSDASDAGAEACANQCGGQCSDPMTDSKNCGKCGNACKSGFMCTEGICGNAITQLVVTSDAACALVHDGDVYCWGSEQNGETTAAIANTSSPTPNKVAALSNIVALTGNAYTLCALDTNGDAWCWGLNVAGALGHDENTAGDQPCGTSGSHCNATPQKVTFATTTKLTRVSAGYQNVCAISVAGDLYCWGNADVFATAASLPAKVAGFSGDAVDVSVGVPACAVNKAGSVLCLGNNYYGALGHTPNTNGDTLQCGFCGYWNQTAVAVAGVSNATSVKVAGNHVCALTSTGDVFCWGEDFKGPIGDGSHDSATHLATKVLSNATTLMSASGENTLALVMDGGAVSAWGDNTFGQLGTGSYTASTTCTFGYTTACQPVPINVPDLSGVQSAALGLATGAAISQSGAVLVWGSNQYAQLGHAPGSGDDVCNEGYDAGIPCKAKVAAMPTFP